MTTPPPPPTRHVATPHILKLVKKVHVYFLNKKIENDEYALLLNKTKKKKKMKKIKN